MTDLPTRMREAAETLRLANERIGREANWSVDAVRCQAKKWAAEDADVETLAEQLLGEFRSAANIMAVWHGGPPAIVKPDNIRRILAGYDIKKRS